MGLFGCTTYSIFDENGRRVARPAGGNFPFKETAEYFRKKLPNSNHYHVGQVCQHGNEVGKCCHDGSPHLEQYLRTFGIFDSEGHLAIEDLFGNESDAIDYMEYNKLNPNCFHVSACCHPGYEFGSCPCGYSKVEDDDDEDEDGWEEEAVEEEIIVAEVVEEEPKVIEPPKDWQSTIYVGMSNDLLPPETI